MKIVLSSIIASVLLSGVSAWGEVGHETIGFIAMQFLAPKAKTFVTTTLANNFSGNLGPGAPWADTVRSTKAFSWSAPFHFVDAEDSPTTGSCSVVQTRDCAAGTCILSAIANYTQRVVSTTLPTEQILEALLFLDHFIGDIGQPLHNEAFMVGGNDISATCAGSSTNLHAVYTGMVVRNIDLNHGGTAQTYANDLVAEIKTGNFESLKSSWISCSSTTQPVAARELIEKRATITPLACPLVWSQEANAFDCSVVFGFTTGEDLCTSTYFTKAVPVIDLQIAKQGFRLAAWLNVLFDGATNL
ncbi:nuclease Le1 [Hysterangium stoloniferum]|nr:nuclease Le1 [Hysterangium stoloniferum]